MRPQLTDEDLDQALKDIGRLMRRRIKEKGRGAFASWHETFGIVGEEYHELAEALRDDIHKWKFYEELADIAVACVIGVASSGDKGV